MILDTFKRAEDTDHIVLRVHEACGGRARFRLKRYGTIVCRLISWWKCAFVHATDCDYCFDSSLDIQSIHRCNILEEDGDVVEYNKNERLTGWITMRAFEILTLKLKLK